MIEQISEYEYLGNSLYKFNSNMNELNVRYDLLYSDKERWNSLSNTLMSLSSKLVNFSNSMESNSSIWKQTASLVFNVKGYWEEPIMVVYNETFDYAANYLEIENWLNDNFNPVEFSPNQILRCDFLCKNYSSEMLEGYRLNDFDPYSVEALSKTYHTTSKKVYTYLGLVNQLNAVITLINFFLTKNNKKTLIVDKIKDLSAYAQYTTYNKTENLFKSSILNTFSDIDLKFFNSYVYQYNMIYTTYKKYEKISETPTDVLKKFELKDISITNGGNFFYKIINGKWTYYPYTHIEFCSNDICGDCYDKININELYSDKRYCFIGSRYTLTLCDNVAPYGEMMMSMSTPVLVDIPENDDTLSQLLR